MAIGLNTDLGTLLNLDHLTLVNGTLTFGKVSACNSQQFAAKCLVTFAGMGSSTITVTLQSDLAGAAALGFSGLNFFVPGSGPANTTVTIDPANGLSQAFWILTDNTYGAGQLRVGAQSNGAVTSGDAIIINGRASVA